MVRRCQLEAPLDFDLFSEGESRLTLHRCLLQAPTFTFHIIYECYLSAPNTGNTDLKSSGTNRWLLSEHMLPVASSSRSRPAGYGRSCTNCFRAKCRCALLADGGACERCRRLSKDCQPTHTARRTTAKTITPSRAAQLEDKLDNLVSMLRSSQQQQQQWQQQPNHTLHYQVAQYLPSSSDGIQSTALDSLAHAVATERDGVCVHGQQARVSPTSNGPQPGLEPWPQEADDFLAKFRTWLPSFPFMYLPPSMTAVTLRAEKPFLWLCIMSFTCTSNSQHQYLRDRVRSEISERIIINHERSMDLLLGLVAYLGWYVTTPRIYSSFILTML